MPGDFPGEKCFAASPSIELGFALCGDFGSCDETTGCGVKSGNFLSGSVFVFEVVVTSMRSVKDRQVKR